MSETTDVSSTGVRRRVLGAAAGALTLVLLVVVACVAWTWTGSAGHRTDAVPDVADAPVAIVFGAELGEDGTPKPFLAGRLDSAAELYRAGTVRALLVSGDGQGDSGDEVTSMARYLTARGVPAARVVADPYGLDSYDTCVRAHRVFGVRRAVLVTQGFHLPRAVTLCRHAGIDADGLTARCDSCSALTLWRNRVRELPAAVKAALDAARDRPPAVVSPRDPTLDTALNS